MGTETKKLDFSVDPKSMDILEHNQHNNQVDTAVISTQRTSDLTDSGKMVGSESKLKDTTKRRGKKLSPSIKSTEPSKGSYIDGEKKGQRLPEKKPRRLVLLLMSTSLLRM